MRLRIIRIIALMLALALLMAACGKLEYVEKDVNIPKGASIASIADILEDEGIIKSAFKFRMFVKRNMPGAVFQSGAHPLNSAMTDEEIAAELQKTGRPSEYFSLTVPEGYELYRIADRVEESGYITREQFMEEVEYGEFDYDFVNDIPRTENRLEGYLFPDTYFIYPETTAHDLVNAMLRRFDEVFDGEMRNRASEVGMSIDEVVTLASIVEREAQGDSDRDLVASVFINRMNTNGETVGLLQSCATVQYILKERKEVLSYEDTRIDSPYNTYIHKGLPCGPIASPGELSLRAALYPAQSDYYYFVYVPSEGRHLFAKTYAEHLNNQKK